MSELRDGGDIRIAISQFGAIAAVVFIAVYLQLQSSAQLASQIELRLQIEETPGTPRSLRRSWKVPSVPPICGLNSV